MAAVLISSLHWTLLPAETAVIYALKKAFSSDQEAKS
jgi:hypothetical protein